MNKTLQPFEKVPQFSKTDVAYACNDETLTPFYKYPCNLEQFRQIVQDKSQETTPRADLVKVLKEQYRQFPDNPYVDRHINALAQENAYTIVTAHQPSLFLGPLYFIYKAITAINLAEEVQNALDDAHPIVPVFVLGSEDHDLEELNHIQLYSKKVVWEPGLEGPVGPMPTDTLKPVLEEVKEILGESEQATYIYSRLEKAYTEQPTFASATQAFLHDLFGRYGLVVLNMNHPDLKKHFIPVMEEELLSQPSFKLVNETIEQLSDLGFKAQASPREINLFYLKEGLRARIIPDGDGYQIHGTDIRFTREAMLEELHAHPEHFSPNVVLRPLYQETILPNLAYVGGGGELAYWLERKTQFEHHGLNFPMLVRRNSVLWIDSDTHKKILKTGFEATDLFEDTDALIRQYVENHAEGEVDISDELNQLARLFDQLAAKAEVTDPGLVKAVRAEETRQTNALQQIQGRLVRAEKQKHEQALNQIRKIKDKLFPNGGMQERSENVLPYFLKYGAYFLDTLKEFLNPLEEGLVIIEDTGEE